MPLLPANQSDAAKVVSHLNRVNFNITIIVLSYLFVMISRSHRQTMFYVGHCASRGQQLGNSFSLYLDVGQELGTPYDVMLKYFKSIQDIWPLL